MDVELLISQLRGKLPGDSSRPGRSRSPPSTAPGRGAPAWSQSNATGPPPGVANVVWIQDSPHADADERHWSRKAAAGVARIPARYYVGE